MPVGYPPSPLGIYVPNRRVGRNGPRILSYHAYCGVIPLAGPSTTRCGAQNVIKDDCAQMAENGTFIISGAERVVVSQMYMHATT